MGSNSASIAATVKEAVRTPDSHHSAWWEAGAFLVCIGYLFFLLREVLFLGTATLSHDNLFWTLPVFTYFAEGIGNGVLPLWNPYTHGGEPLAHIYLTTRLLDPVSVAVAWFGQFATSDLILLANWDRVAKMLVAAFGAYLLLRQWTVSVLVRIALVPVLVLSNFTVNAFWQPGILDQFIYTPFFLIFLLNLLWKRDYRWHNWVGAATFFGASVQSYFFVGPSLAAALFLFGFALFRRDHLFALFTTRANWPRILLALAIIGAMAGPQAYLYRDLERFDLPARGDIADEKRTVNDTGALPKVGMPYETIHQTGSFSQIQDFVGLLVPGLLFLRRTSEAGLYLGGLVFIGALYGMVFAGHPLKRVWVLVGAGAGLLMLGPLGGLHWLLYHVFPPLWFLRHTAQLAPLFQLAILFFFAIGADAWLQRWRRDDATLSPSTTGPLGRWLKNPGHGRAIAIVAVVGMMLIFVPYLARWDSERPTVFGLASFTLLGMGVTMYLLRHDLGHRLMASTVALGMLALTPLLSHRPGVVLINGATSEVSRATIDVFFQVWLYAGIFVLAPLVLIYLGSRGDISDAARFDGSGGNGTDRPAPLGVVLVGFAMLLFVSLGFFYIPLAPDMSIEHFWAHVVLSFLASVSALGMLHARWLISTVQALRARASMVRLAAGLVCIALLVPVVYSTKENYFDLEAYIYFNPVMQFYRTKTFFYFHWLSLITICVIVMILPHLLPNALERIRTVADARRFIVRTILLCGLVPELLIFYKAFSSGYIALQPHEIAMNGIYVTAALTEGGRRLQMPWGSMAAARTGAGTPLSAMRTPGYLFPSILILWMSLDLTVSIASLSPDVSGIYLKPLWNAPRPETTYTGKAQSRMPVFPPQRVITSPVASDVGPYVYRTGQEMRYADLFARVATMLDLPTDTRQRSAQEIATASLDEQLGWTRHNGFIQFKNYSALIRSGLHPDVLAEMFSLERPLIQFRPCAESREDFAQDVRTLPPEDVVSVLRNTVILDNPSRGRRCRETATIQSGPAYEVLEYDHDSVKLKINAPAGGYLYYADGYDPYWEASVDAKPASLYRANFNFKAVVVDKGEHEVEFVYSPTLLQRLIGIYFAVFVAGLAVIFGSLMRSSLAKSRGHTLNL